MCVCARARACVRRKPPMAMCQTSDLCLKARGLNHWSKNCSCDPVSENQSLCIEICVWFRLLTIYNDMLTPYSTPPSSKRQ